MPLKIPDAVTQICSYKKDEYYVNSLKGLLTECVKNIFGENFSLVWSKEINVLADVVYFTLTTAGSLQTLGEEYTNIIQVDSTLRNTPSLKQRAVMIICHSVLPLLFEKILNHLEHKVFNSQLSCLSDEHQAILSQVFPRIRTLLVTAHRLHLSLFYINQIYYTISKRISLINYVKYFVNPSHNLETFSVLGKFSLAQAILMVALQLSSLYKEVALSLQLTKPEVSQSVGSHKRRSSDHSRNKCSLCLEVRLKTCVCPCGHLFCWTCIHKSLSIKQECPLCREKVLSNQVVILQNY